MLDNITFGEVIEIIKEKRINIKNNNYVFFCLTEEQMKIIKEILSEQEYTKIIDHKPETTEEQIKESKNIVYDCKTDSISELLDWKSVSKNIKVKFNYPTINLINFQKISDEAQLQSLTETILNNSSGMCFNLFTTKETYGRMFTKKGKGLDPRDDMGRYFVEPGTVYKK